MMNFTAVKPVYNRKTKKYDIEVVENADVLLAHNGYFVFDDLRQARNAVIVKSLLGNWKPAKRDAVLAWLTARIN